MTIGERSQLEELLARGCPRADWRATFKWFALWSGGLVVCALAVAGALLAMPGGMVRGPEDLAAVVACGFIVAIFGLAAIVCLYAMISILQSRFQMHRLQATFARDRVPVIREALADGRVKVKHVTAAAVIELAEFEDEGSGWLFDVGSGQVLLLKGQKYVPENEADPWPNSEFEIVRTQRGAWWMGLFCRGTELKPIRTLELSDCRKDFAWGEDREELLDGDISSVADGLLAAAK